MAIRVTNLTIQALVHLIHVVEGPASNDLEMAQVIGLNSTLNNVLTNDLSIDNTVYLANTYDLSAESALDFQQEITGPFYEIAVANELECDQILAAGGRFDRSAENTLNLSQVVGVIHSYIESLIEQGSIGGTVQATGPWYKSVQSTVALAAGETNSGPWYNDAENPLATYEEVFDPETFQLVLVPAGLTHSVTVSAGNVPLSAIQQIGLQQFVNGYVIHPGSIVENVSQALTLNVTARESIPLSATSNLIIGQFVTFVLGGTPATNAITMLNTASNTLVSGLSAINALALGQHLFLQVVDLHRDCLAQISLPTSGGTGFKLQYPPELPTLEVVLRSPEFGNLYRLTADRVNQETRGGTLVVFADPIWPKVETLVMPMTLLKTVPQQLLTFMQTTLGKEIKLIDFENRAWVGVIVDPQGAVVEDSRGGFAVSFEFEGVRSV